MTERIGPYRVYERLGVGGMGEVFKAYDDRLDRWVAIKRIRPDRLDAEDNRERFKREARATARLNHPSIVHLYGIFQDEEDADCIVMEFVDGRTLDTFLSEGPLEPPRVARLGHEIASGLAEAHANGILHRDLKAENIMITPRGRAKILDFGLAKPILSSELDPVLTSKGQLVGTSRAMSPEYVSGEEVDHRSDLFALGVLLYECLTGQSPFKAHNTLATLKQVMLHKQQPVIELNPDVPPELSELIDRLLSKDPRERPQNAEEVALAFGRVTGQISSGIIDTPNFGSGTHPQTGGSTSTITASDTMLDLRPRNRRLTMLGILAVAFIGVFFLGRLFVGGGGARDDRSLPPDQRIRIVIGQFANNSDEEMLGASLGEAFRAVLEQSQTHTVLSQTLIKDTLARMELPLDATITREIGIEICEREGAERLIIGSVTQFGNTYSLIVDVIDPADDKTVHPVTATASSQDELLSTIEDMAQNVRAHLGESTAEIERGVPLERVTTSNLDALKAYTVGQNLVASGNSIEAIDYFERAVVLDPRFAMAHAKLGVAYANLSQQEEAVAAFQTALEYEGGLSEFQKLYVKGWLARWQRAPKDVIANFSLMAELYPNDETAAYNLGLALWSYRNDFDGAAEALRKAVSAAREQNRDLVQVYLATALTALERLEQASATLESADHPSRVPALIRIALARGDPAAAADLLGGLAEPDLSLSAALVAAYELRFDDAADLLQRRLDEARDLGAPSVVPRILAEQAALAFIADDSARFEAVVADSLAFTEAGELNPASTQLLLFLARLSLRFGDEALAASVLDRFETLIEPGSASFLTEAFTFALAADVALTRDGALEVAADQIQKALALTTSVQLLELKYELARAEGDGEQARRVLRQIAERPGLSLVESMNGGSTLYSLLLPRLAAQRLEALATDDPDASSDDGDGLWNGLGRLRTADRPVD